MPFLLKTVKVVKIFIHQTDKRPKYSFISVFVFCLMNIFHLSSLLNIILSDESVIIGSVSRWVGGSVSKWLLDLIKPFRNDKNQTFYRWPLKATIPDLANFSLEIYVELIHKKVVKEFN